MKCRNVVAASDVARIATLEREGGFAMTRVEDLVRDRAREAGTTPAA
ncbi:MAG: hypothetical protein WB493_06255 [Anaeromyxobacteraceae bacterium]